jgi:hypothetical protein
MKYIEHIEFLGVVSAIIGSFLVATGHTNIGYIFFLHSSVGLLYSAFKQHNVNLMLLQFTFTIANIVGISHYIFKV